MTDDKLDKQKLAESLELFERVKLTQYPNPQRVGCLANIERSQFLHTLAFNRREIPITDKRLDHLGKCSPCFSEFVQFRNEARLLI